MLGKIESEMYPPCEFIQDEVAARNWSLLRLAEMACLPPDEIDSIVEGDLKITPKRAEALGRAFGTSAALWRRLQISYDAGVITPDEAEAIMDQAEVTK